MSMDWEEVGDRAFNWYFRVYDKEIDHDAAQEAAVDEITGAMDEHGIEFEESWSIDMPPEVSVRVFQKIGERVRDCEKDLGRPVSGEFLWPMHTWLSDALFQAKQIHGDDKFNELDAFINNTLPQSLPKD